MEHSCWFTILKNKLRFDNLYAKFHFNLFKHVLIIGANFNGEIETA